MLRGRINPLIRAATGRLTALQLFQLIKAGTLILISIGLTRIFGNDKTVIARYEFLTVVGAASSFFWVSGYINAFIPFHDGESDAGKRSAVHNVFLLLTGLGLLTAGGIVLFAQLTPDENVSTGLLSYFALYVLFNTPTFLVETLLMLKDRGRDIILFALITFGGQFAVVLGVLTSGGNLQTVVFGLIGLALLKYIYLLRLILQYGDKRHNLRTLKRLTAKALPVSGGLLVSGSAAYIDSFLIRYLYPDDAFAVYQYGARELPFVLLLANAFSNVKSGEIAEACRLDTLPAAFAKLRRQSARLMHILFPISLLFLLFSERLFVLVYNDSYAESARIFDWFVLIVVPRLVFPQTVILGLQRNTVLFTATIAELILHIGLSLWLINSIGPVGAAVATLTAYVFDKIILSISLDRRGYPIRLFTPLRTLTGYTLLLTAAYIIKQFLY